MDTAAAPRHYALSVDDFHRMAEAGILHEDSRVELIAGELIQMSPIGKAHASTVKLLIRILTRAIGDRAIVSVQDPIVLDAYSEPEPDIALLRYRDDFYADAAPGPGDVLLIIEVADTSLSYDTGRKLPLYARHGIAETWLFDTNAQSLAVYREPASDGYQAVDSNVDLSCLSPICLPGIALDLSRLRTNA